MIAAIYSKENYGTLPVNSAIRVYKVAMISRERRERERRRPAFNDVLTHMVVAGSAMKSNNYNAYGQLINDQEQLFNKLA